MHFKSLHFHFISFHFTVKTSNKEKVYPIRARSHDVTYYTTGGSVAWERFSELQDVVSTTAAAYLRPTRCS